MAGHFSVPFVAATAPFGPCPRQAVSPLDRMVFCPLRYRGVPPDRCLDCSRLVRADTNEPPRHIICDARMIDRR